MSIMLFVRDIEVTDRYFDTRTGKMVSQTYNPVREVQKLGIKTIPMPEDYILYERKVKNEVKRIYMHELGCFALVRVDNGRIQNSYNGQRLGRIQFLSLSDIKELLGIFNGMKGKAQGESHV